MIRYLETLVIPETREFAVHPEATHYFVQSGKIRFYRVNPSPTEKMEIIPFGSNTMRFPTYRRNRFNINYGSPEFRGHRESI
jgi:hypothetical protein